MTNIGKSAARPGFLLDGRDKMPQPDRDGLLRDAPILPAEMRDFYDDLVERTDAIAREYAHSEIVPLMHELALCIAADGPANAERRTAEEWARGIALTAVIATVIDEPDEMESSGLRTVFLSAMGSDIDATAQCTADILMSAGVIDMGADWSLPC
jgi:hypothetical protein